MHFLLQWENHFQHIGIFFSYHKIILRPLENVQYMTSGTKLEFFVVCPEKYPLVQLKAVLCAKRAPALSQAPGWKLGPQLRKYSPCDLTSKRFHTLYGSLLVLQHVIQQMKPRIHHVQMNLLHAAHAS